MYSSIVFLEMIPIPGDCGRDLSVCCITSYQRVISHADGVRVIYCVIPCE